MVSGRKDGKCGPGSYQPNYSFVYEKTQASTMNKSDIKSKPFRTATDKKFRKKNKGSIRADFEEDSDDSIVSEGSNRGPGTYISEKHSTSFADYLGKVENKSPKAGNFGSIIPRF